MNTDFAFAYYVDDRIGLRHLKGVCVGIPDVETGEVREGVLSPESARRLAKQLVGAADEMENNV